MPDGSVMVSFTRATGPVLDRPRAPREIQERLEWPPGGDSRYDMTGLDLRNVHLRSYDQGVTWKEVSADPFRSPMNGVTGECETATPIGHDHSRRLGILSALRSRPAPHGVSAAID